MLNIYKQFKLFLLLVIALIQPAFAACSRSDSGIMQGVATHFGFRNRLLPPLTDLSEAGFKSIRDEVFWEHVEITENVLSIPHNVEAYVTASMKSGLVPVLVLGYGNPLYDKGDKPKTVKARTAWKRYAEFVVRHFKGRVHHYELWNEWDSAIGGTNAGHPNDLVNLVNEVAPSLKEIDPSLCLIAGAVSPEAIASGWLFKAIQAGLLQEVDALSVHTYNYHAKSLNMRTPEAWQRQLRILEKQLSDYPHLVSPQIYVTEMGWPSAWNRYGLSQALQSAYAQRLFLLSHTLAFLNGVWWYGWQNEGKNPMNSEHHFGIVDHKGNLKPVWHALKEQTRLLEGLHWNGFESQNNQRVVLKFDAHSMHRNTKSSVAKNDARNLGANKMLWAMWRTDRHLENVELVPDSATGLASSQFSTSCMAKKIARGWQVQLSETPCLVRITGNWIFN